MLPNVNAVEYKEVKDSIEEQIQNYLDSYNRSITPLSLIILWVILSIIFFIISSISVIILYLLSDYHYFPLVFLLLITLLGAFNFFISPLITLIGFLLQLFEPIINLIYNFFSLIFDWFP